MDSLSFLKAGLLLFWTLWFGIVLLTNLFGALKAMGTLAASWRFASKNYEALVKATAIYAPPPWLPAMLFFGVVAWQLIAFVLFAAAFIASSRSGALDMTLVNCAFGTGLALWAAFMLADEIVLKYEFERTHEMLFIAQLATLIALHVL